MNRIVLSAMLALAVPGCPREGEAPAASAAQVAPEFALPGSDGKTHKLSDYRGKVVVLAWFPKAFTGG